MALAQSELEAVYNPSSLLHIFNSTLNNATTRKIFKVKGIYTSGKGANYNGVFYDTLHDEATEACMTLVIPGVLRAQLSPNEVIECSAYLTKKVQLNGGRIDLQLNAIEVLSKTASSYTDTQLKAFEVLKKKSEIGHKDVDGFIKSKIINEEPITVIILIGKTGIIDSDIKHQLQEAISFYKFHFVRINLTSQKEIMESLNYYQKKADILAISRGGGEKLEIFDSPEIAETSLSLATYFITAIGHQANVPLLQKVADKPFITPTALGQYFNEIYNKTIEELQNSKAKLVRDITAQLESNYNKQIEILNINLVNAEKNRDRDIHLLNQQLQATREDKNSSESQVKELQKQVEKAGKINVYTLLLLVAVLVIGFLIGKLLI